MRICHVSDTHGRFIPLYGKFDVVVHSGDFLPDPPGNPSFKDQIGLWQLDWLSENMEGFKKWIGQYPFLFILGNHDHVKPVSLEKLLKDNGIKAQCLHDKIVNCDGINFYGFPYVPYINGMFAYEKDHEDMQVEVDKMVKKINKSSLVDVWVCHSPPYGILDESYNKDKIGSTVISNALSFKIKKEKLPSYYLCGHVHCSRGFKICDNIGFSNSAVFQQIIEI